MSRLGRFIMALYGSGVTLNQLIFDHNAPRIPDSARQFMNALTAAARAQN